MSDLTYNVVCAIGRPPFRVSSRPVRLHRDRIPRSGAAILAPTHLSNFDVPVLLADSPRHIDFMSVVEFLDKPFVGRLFTGMNCFFLDRGRVDVKAVRQALHKLEGGRMIAIFPEGRIRAWEDSVVHGRPFKPGVARIAVMAGAPVVPCVVLGTGAYTRVASWLPLRRVRYGMNFGKPIRPRADLDPAAAEADVTARLAAAYVELYRELRPTLPDGVVPPDPPA